MAPASVGNGVVVVGALVAFELTGAAKSAEAMDPGFNTKIAAPTPPPMAMTAKMHKAMSMFLEQYDFPPLSPAC